MFKRLFLICTVLMVIFIPRTMSAAELSEAELRLVCALSSMASYEDDNGIMVRDMLKNLGWKIEPIKDETEKVNAKALIISKNFNGGELTKILAICGTSDLKDAEVDVRMKQVPANENNSKQNDESKIDKKNQILVHQGFKDYSEVILNNNLGINLFRELANNPNERLYLTGHSLGGAVAILTASKLIDLGVPEDKMRVITFGAPAVGNKGFVDEYKDSINLTRVTMSGDPVKKSLQAMGYVHFGEVKKYNQDKKTVKHFPHKMSVYLDCAIRDYYDERFKLNKELDLPENINTPQVSESIYIAPVQVMKKSFAESEFKYVKAIMKDRMRQHFPTAVYDENEYIEVEEVDDLADFDNSVAGLQQKAAESNCKYIMVYYLQAKKIKDDMYSNYRITVEGIKYDQKGLPTAMQTASVTTTELTTIEAAIFAFENLYRKGD